MSYQPAYSKFEDNTNSPTPGYSDYGNQLNQQGEGGRTTVVVQNPGNVTQFNYDAPVYPFQWCNLGMSVFSFLCCCSPVFGVLGMVFAANSYVSHGEKLYERSNRQNTIARIFWIIAVVIGVVSLIGIIIAVVSLANTASQYKKAIENAVNDG